MELPTVVSLFSGAGGLDLGFSREGFPVSFAVDISEAAIKTHQRNFRGTTSVAADLVKVGPTGVVNQIRGLIEPGAPIGVIGGPPCQGFSRANTGAASDDPRNRLPLLYLEIVEALQEFYKVQFVLFENVLGICDSKHSDVFSGILSKFEEIGLYAGVKQYSALDYGVAQARNRVVISGFASDLAATIFTPVKVRTRRKLTVRSVIGRLPQPVYFSRGLRPEDIPYHPNHWTMRPISKRFGALNDDARQGRSFRRLAWDKPSPTVAYGHREIHVHPDGQRRLSIFEAMLLQGFPRNFVLEGTFSAQVDQVSNAVPPPLAQALAGATKQVLVARS